MSWLSDTIFGKSPKAETTNTPTMTPEQEAMLQNLLGSLSPTGNTPYTGQLSASQNALQGQSLAAMEQAAMNAVAPGNPQDVSTKALTDVIGQGPQDLSSYFKSTITDPAMQTFNESILPAISQRFKGQSGFGSDRSFQEGIAAGNTATGIAGAMGQASLTALQQQQQNKIAAATGLSGVTGAGTQNLLALQQGGTTAQAAAQAPLSAAYQEFARQQGQKQLSIQDILAALGLKTTDIQTVVTPGTAGLLAGASGGVGQGLGMAGAAKLMAL